VSIIIFFVGTIHEYLSIFGQSCVSVFYGRLSMSLACIATVLIFREYYCTMWNPVYEKCGKVVGITVQIMFLSDVGRRC